MTEYTMAGLHAAQTMEKEELLSIIDRFDLKDYSSGKLIAPLWRNTPSPASLTVDCIDPSTIFQPGAYILEALPHILLEGIKIAELILAPASLSLLLPDGLAVPPPLSGIPLQRDCTTKGLIHSAETFVSLSRLFRREGADKRICKISCPSTPPIYCELPITVSLQEIARQLGLKNLTGAQLGEDPENSVPSDCFFSTHPLGEYPSIYFY